ncbi:hypothetical protein G9A89_004574 [Geosiphon pyriformis]|nr:hypothetical protein G9A89_004574 [Geosiphon pyriformis]
MHFRTNSNGHFLIAIIGLFALSTNVAAHGRMELPAIRLLPGDDNNGFTVSRGPTKTQPCANLPPGPIPDKSRFKVGDSVPIQWQITAAHQGKCFIELSTTGSDSDFKVLKEFDHCADDNGEFKDNIPLPAGVSCEKCTMRWRWEAKLTNELYINCADISIGAGSAGSSSGSGSPGASKSQGSKPTATSTPTKTAPANTLSHPSSLPTTTNVGNSPTTPTSVTITTTSVKSSGTPAATSGIPTGKGGRKHGRKHGKSGKRHSTKHRRGKKGGKKHGRGGKKHNKGQKKHDTGLGDNGATNEIPNVEKPGENGIPKVEKPGKNGIPKVEKPGKNGIPKAEKPGKNGTSRVENSDNNGIPKTDSETPNYK